MEKNGDPEPEIHNYNTISLTLKDNRNKASSVTKQENKVRNAENLPLNSDTVKRANTVNVASYYSQQEVVNLTNFKIYSASMNYEYRFDLYGSDIILRFLKAKKNNIKEAFEMFKKYIEFCESFDINHLSSVQFPNLDKIKIFYPHGFHKTTKENSPVFIQMLGQLKVDDINRILPEKMLTQYIAAKFCELTKDILPKCSKFYGKKIEKVFCVVDLLGLTTSLMNKKVFNFVKRQLDITTQFYPGLVSGLYFVNVGVLFRATWATCKFFYDAETRSKIKLLGFDYKAELLEKIEARNLPKFFGGECNCDPYGCLFGDEGPWKGDGGEKKTNNRRNVNYLEKLKKRIEEDEKKERDFGGGSYDKIDMEKEDEK